MQENLQGKGWKSIPWAASNEREALFTQYLFSQNDECEIPSLLVLDAVTGTVLTTSGKDEIMNNPSECLQVWKSAIKH